MRKLSFMTFVLGTAALFTAFSFLFAPSSFSQEAPELVTKGLFIERFFVNKDSRADSARPFLPEGVEKLPPEERYAAVVAHMKSRGVVLLVGTNPDDPLTWEEYIGLTYLLAGGTPRKSLAEQMVLLKEKGVFRPNQIGFFKAVQGKALVTRANAQKPVPVKSADPVIFKDLDETEFNSRAEILLDDGSTLTIGEDTVIRIDELVYNPKTNRRSVSIRLAVGSIQLNVAKNSNPDSKFNVITPTLVAGVRGTSGVLIVVCKIKFETGMDLETYMRLCGEGDKANTFIWTVTGAFFAGGKTVRPGFVLSKETVASKTYLHLQYPRPVNLIDLTYVPQISSDLSDWSSNDIVEVDTVTNPADQTETVTVAFG